MWPRQQAARPGRTDRLTAEARTQREDVVGGRPRRHAQAPVPLLVERGHQPLHAKHDGKGARERRVWPAAAEAGRRSAVARWGRIATVDRLLQLSAHAGRAASMPERSCSKADARVIRKPMSATFKAARRRSNNNAIAGGHSLSAAQWLSAMEYDRTSIFPPCIVDDRCILLHQTVVSPRRPAAEASTCTPLPLSTTRPRLEYGRQ